VSPWVFLGVPLVGGLIGYLTNRIAVVMIFRPIRPRRALGLTLQGLVPRRQRELAENIGGVVGDHLVRHDDIIECFERADLEKILSGVVDRALASKLDELRRLPLVGNFLTAERADELKRGFVESLLKRRAALFEGLEQALEQGLDVQAIVRDKVAGFPVEKLEELVLRVASRELRAIEVLGGVLGVLIGCVQVLLIWLTD
jgi:uncharacterized membrane protein YheB (UPF0754 family)